MPNNYIDINGAQTLYNDLRGRAARADGNLAAEYSTSATYPVGAYVMYKDKLYRCKTAVTTAGSWASNSSKFEQTNFGEETSNLKSAIDYIREDEFYLINAVIVEHSRYANGNGATVGDTVSLDPITGAAVSYNSVKLVCVKGQKFVINLSGGTGSVAYSFVDSNGVILATSPYESIYQNKAIYAPDDGYLLCNTKNSYSDAYVKYEATKPLPENSVTTAQIVNNSVTTGKIADGSVKPGKTDFFYAKSHNMIDTTQATMDYYYSPGSARIIAMSNPPLTYGVSALIPVVPGQAYCLSGNGDSHSGGYFGEGAEIIADQAAIEGITFYTPVDNNGFYFIVPENDSIKYVALNVKRDSETGTWISTVQLEEGEMATEYQPYHLEYYIKKQYLPNSSNPADVDDVELLPRPSYAFEASKISNFREHWIKKDKDLVVAGTGTSLTARSSEHCTTRDDATSRPPLMHSNNFASRIWDRIKWEGQQYRRFDYTDFFTETGTFASSSTLSDWDDASYRDGMTRYASAPASVQFTVPKDAWQFNFIFRSDSVGTESATVAIAEGNGKMEAWNGTAWVEANGFTFSMKETAVTLSNIDIPDPKKADNGTVRHNSYKVGGNTTFQKRLKMRCKSGTIDSRDSEKTVTISATSGRLLYWGVEWSPREYMITYINAARGSHNMTVENANALYHYQDNEIWSFKPDLIFSENPIHNSGGGNSTFTNYYPTYWGYATYDFFFNEASPVSLISRAAVHGITDLEWIVFTSSVSWNFSTMDDDGNLIISPDKDGNMITALDAQSMCDLWIRENEPNVISINGCKYWVDAGRSIFGDLKSATVGSGKNGNTFTNEGSHWNDTGCKVMDRCIGGVFDLYN